MVGGSVPPLLHTPLPPWLWNCSLCGGQQGAVPLSQAVRLDDRFRPPLRLEVEGGLKASCSSSKGKASLVSIALQRRDTQGHGQRHRGEGKREGKGKGRGLRIYAQALRHGHTQLQPPPRDMQCKQWLPE